MRYFLIVLATFFYTQSFSWGFFAHKKINYLAVFTLPPEIIEFYKINIEYISETAINPDKRRYIDKEEGCRHFIDLDKYHDSVRFSMPKYWNKALEKFPEDTLKLYGIVPWHIYLLKFQLTQAFKNRDQERILKISSEIGHYISDAHVPLHTTYNYNGQFTDQHGIHGFWESRLPELFFGEYDLFLGNASYLDDVQGSVWSAVYHSHQALDSVLSIEKKLSQTFGSDKKFSFEERNGLTIKVYSFDFSKTYHYLLNSQVEKRIKASIKMVGDIWFTAWVDAGQPYLGKHRMDEIPFREENIPFNNLSDHQF
ncbi:MAG TPA: zinc dependent phospholipase C family protein [Cytophagaceae bacterium]|jgi:hypothetical protein